MSLKSVEGMSARAEINEYCLGQARSANIKAAPDDLSWRGFVASIWRQLTARRLRPLLASAGIGIPLRAQVFALGTVGVDPPIREEIFLHLIDDATRDLALTAPTPTAQEQ